MDNTGSTVLNENGVLVSCTKRQNICGYACCKFSVGNWIMLLPGEYDLAKQLNLNNGHLIFQNNLHAVCTKPCTKGDLKPIDCSWYPLFPANQSATKFLVADHRKCPIPNKELIGKMLPIHKAALAWEQQYPGTLEQIVALSRGFVGYMPFPYKIENDSVIEMSDDEQQEIALPNEFPADYVCKEWSITQLGYSATKTPEDEN